MNYVEILKALDEPVGDISRERVLDWLVQDFVCTHSRFFLRVLGKDPPTPSNALKRQLRETVEVVLRLRLTFDRVLSFWEYRIQDFSPDAFPGLEFFTRSGVATEALAAVPPAEPGPPAVGALDPHLRRGMADAGLDLGGWNDGALLTVQRMAEIALDRESFFVPRNLQGYVDTAREILSKRGIRPRT